MSKSASLKAHVERWGLWGTARYLMLRVGSDLLGIHVFVARARRTPPELENPCRLPGIEYRRVESEELVRLAADSSLLLDEEFVTAALARSYLP